MATKILISPSEHTAFRNSMEEKYGHIEEEKTCRASIVIRYAELYRIVMTEHLDRIVQVTFEDRFQKEVGPMNQILLFHTEQDAEKFLFRLDATGRFFFNS